MVDENLTIIKQAYYGNHLNKEEIKKAKELLTQMIISLNQRVI